MSKVSYPNLHPRIHSHEPLLDETDNAVLTKTITVSKKPVEQLGYLKDVNSLVVLSGAFDQSLGSTVVERAADISATVYLIRPPTLIATLQGKSRLLLHHTHVLSTHLSTGKITDNISPNDCVLSRCCVQAEARDLFVEGWRAAGGSGEIIYAHVLSELKVCRKFLYHTHPGRCPS